MAEPERIKPDCELIGQNGNIYNLMGIASRTLRENGMKQQAEEMFKRITGGDCRDYYDEKNEDHLYARTGER